MRWLRSDPASGAERIKPVPGMKVWQIPDSAMRMKLPKPGPPRGTKTTDVKKSSNKIGPKK